ncbi:MAG: hypothetical protein H6707_04540 [Deltaproteobacteria bacterium]|nr:hypothetical protein [Deltaproteobacteria bacterium]
MREVLIVCGILLGLVATAALFAIGGSRLFVAGCLVTAVGAAVGIPAGAYYHLLLYRVLRRQGPLPASWIWRPLRLHERLPERGRRRVLFWCYLGAAGFLVICVGLLMVGVAARKLSG